MKFTKLTISTTTEGSELVADMLWRYTVYGVSIEDPLDFEDVKRVVTWDYADESIETEGEAKVSGFVPFDEDDTLSKIYRDLEELKTMSRGNVDLGTMKTCEEVVDGDEWREIWRERFRPINFGAVAVVPEWIEYSPKEGEKLVYIDSNMAFGTGEHETTAMCVELIEEYVRGGETFLDVGCGSGILGISALKLGARRAILTDIDAVAVESATHNCERNGVSDRATVLKTDLLDGVKIEADIAAANITAEILCTLAESLPACLKSGATLILSGIITDRLQKVKERYISAGFEFVRAVRRGEWHAAVFQKK